MPGTVKNPSKRYRNSGFVLAILFIGMLLALKYSSLALATLGGPFAILLLIILIWFLIGATETGAKFLGKGCVLITYSFLKRDHCEQQGCPGPCSSFTTKPYPSWMGRFAPATQATSCICSKNPFAKLARRFQNALNKAIGLKEKADLREEINRIIQKYGIINPDNELVEDVSWMSDRLNELGSDGQLNDEDRERIKEILDKIYEYDEEVEE